MSKTESAVRYFTVPKDVKVSMTSMNVEGELSFRQFFVDYMLGRLANKTVDDMAIVRSLSRFAKATAGTKVELPEEHWARLRNSLPPVNQPGGVLSELYLQALSFWEALIGTPTSKPEGWDDPEPAVSE